MKSGKKMKKVLFAMMCTFVMATGGFLVSCQQEATPQKPQSKYDTQMAITWQDFSIKEEYAYGESFSAPKVDVTLGGEVVKPDMAITLPDGSESTKQEILLNQVGEYTVTYTVNKGVNKSTKTEKFSVRAPKFYFDQANSTYSYGAWPNYGCTKEGLIVNLALKDTLLFTQTVSVDQLTSAQSFFEGYIVPKTRGVYDFSKLIVTLTDAEDDSVYLSYSVNRYHPSSTAGVGFAFISVGGNGTDMIGVENGTKIHINDDLGASINPVGFTGTMCYDVNRGESVIAWTGPIADIVPDKSLVKLSFDNETMDAYVNGQLIANLSDSSLFKNGTWGGFKSDKVRISITADKYESSAAHFVITNLLGQELTLNEDNKCDVYEDTNKPVIIFDSNEELSYAKKGLKFKIPTAKAFDLESGWVDVETSVYYNYSSPAKVDVPVDNGYFTPDKEGWYCIEYVARDTYGNKSTVVKEITAKTVVDPISITLPAERMEEVSIGEELIVNAPTYDGGCGGLSHIAYAYCGDLRVDIENGRFVPEKVGEWTVEYLVTDYVGEQQVKGYKVNCTSTTQPVRFFQDPVLPKVMISNTSCELPVLYAVDYSSGVRVEKLSKVKVSYGGEEKVYNAGDTFVPTVNNDGDKISVQYFYEDVYLSAEEVKCVKPIVEETFVFGSETITTKAVDKTKYIVGENLTVKAAQISESEKNLFFANKDVSSYIELVGGEYRLRTGILVAAKAAGTAEWTYANALVADRTSIEILALKNGKKYKTLQIELVDSANKDQRVVLTIDEEAKTAKVLGNKDVKLTSATLDSVNTFISYKNGTFNINGANVNVSEYENGAAFNGFASKKVYLTVRMTGADQDSGYIVGSVSDSVLSYNTADNSRPKMVYSTEFSKSAQLNDTIVVPNVICVDAYAPVLKVLMTVKAPDGKTIVKDKAGRSLKDVDPNGGYEIVMSQFGTYKFTYTITKVKWIDEVGYETKYTVSNEIKVLDTEGPRINLKSDVKSRKFSNESIALPAFTVSDNVSSQENIRTIVYVIDPTGEPIKVQNNAFKPKVRGRHQYVIIAIDESGNSTSVITEFDLT